MSDKISLQIGNATALPHPNEAFDRAYMLHVGMNIADKRTLYAEIRRVLAPGGRLLIFNVIQVKIETPHLMKFMRSLRYGPTRWDAVKDRKSVV